MKCPVCGGRSGTIDTRRRNDGLVWRGHECKLCQFRFSTFEIYAKDYKTTQSIVNFIKGIKGL